MQTNIQEPPWPWGSRFSFLIRYPIRPSNNPHKQKPPRLPLILVVECGDVVEGWFDCRGVDQDALREFFQRAVKMGADEHLWNKHAKVPVPGGAGGRNATIEFFNAEIPQVSTVQQQVGEERVVI